MRQTNDATSAWNAVVSADPAEFDRAEVAALLGSIAQVRSVCDAVEVRAVRRTRELAQAGRAEPPESLLASATGRSSRQSKAAAAREDACAAMPPIESALAAGIVSAGHVDAAASVHGRLSPEVGAEFAARADDLAMRAGVVGVDAFERECRDLARFLQAQHDVDAAAVELDRQRANSSVKRWVDRASGMHMTLLGLDPLRDAQMWKTVNARVAGLRQQQRDTDDTATSFTALQAQAFVSAVAAPSTEGGAPRIPEISVLIDLDALTGRAGRAGVVCEADDGTPLPISTVRRLCCEADVLPIVLGNDGVVLDQGRRFRTATADQRVALAALHRSCVYPGCTVDVTACRMHHIRWWGKHFGRTDLSNLVPVCERHHHLVHEGGWGLTMTEERDVTWTRPDGKVHSTGPSLDRRPRDVPMRA